MTRNSFFFEGSEIPLDETAFAGARLLQFFRATAHVPPPEEPPYLFCGNGSCRDCNLSIDGFPDLPACRIPLAPGMSLRGGEGAGEENALSRHLPRASEGELLVCDVLVVGAGPAGRVAAREARGLGLDTVVVEARSDVDAEGVRSLSPAGVLEGRLHVFEYGTKRAVRARAIVLANGARDASAVFPGSTLAGVLPCDLLERYVALGRLPARSFAVAMDDREIESVSGTARVERVRIAGLEGDVAVDLVFVRFHREPELSLSKALGCRTFYDRALRCERLVVGAHGETSVDGIFAAGDVVRVGTEADAREAGGHAARAAARQLSKLSQLRKTPSVPE